MNEWEEWQAKILAQTKTQKAASPAIRPMYAAFGRTPGRKCGECAHLLANPYHNKVYYKCGLARVSSSVATDFRKKWEACGRFEKKSSDEVGKK